MKPLEICVHDEVKVEDVVVSDTKKKFKDREPVVFAAPVRTHFVSPDSTWAPALARSPSVTLSPYFNVQSRTVAL